MHPRLFPLTSIVLAATFALTVATSPVVAAPSEGGPASSQNVATIEREFLTGMIPHHRGAVDMATMCVEKAIHDELRDLCEKNIEDQNREKDLLAGYLQSWYAMEPPAGNMMPAEQMREMNAMLHDTMPDMMARMQGMDVTTGEDFEVEFMSSLFDHHSQAIMMASPVLISAEHSELYPVAQQIVKQQGDDLEKLKTWLKDWYGIERPM